MEKKPWEKQGSGFSSGQLIEHGEVYFRLHHKSDLWIGIIHTKKCNQKSEISIETFSYTLPRSNDLSCCPHSFHSSFYSIYVQRIFRRNKRFTLNWLKKPPELWNIATNFPDHIILSVSSSQVWSMSMTSLNKIYNWQVLRKWTNWWMNT